MSTESIVVTCSGHNISDAIRMHSKEHSCPSVLFDIDAINTDETNLKHHMRGRGLRTNCYRILSPFFLHFIFFNFH